jgi:hypothetical protein
MREGRRKVSDEFQTYGVCFVSLTAVEVAAGV